MTDGSAAGSRCNDARAGLGDWEVNRAKLPHGIDGLAEKAEELGIRFGIWVEPEMVNPQSELFTNHPDWVIGLPGRENRLERSQYLLDLGNPEVRGHILGVMRELLGKHPDIAYVKWDCNRKISDPGSAWLDARHQGNLAIDYVRGYESVLDALAEEFPQVVSRPVLPGAWPLPITAPCGGTRVLDIRQYGCLRTRVHAVEHRAPVPGHFHGRPRDGFPQPSDGPRRAAEIPF